MLGKTYEADAASLKAEELLGLKPAQTAQIGNVAATDISDCDRLKATGLWEEAIGCLDRAIKVNGEYIQQNPNNAAAWNNKGVELYLQANIDRDGYGALKDFSDAGHISKNLAHTRYRHQKWAEALECIEKSTQLDPKCSDAWYNRGLALFAQGVGGESIDFFKEVVHCFDQAQSLPPKEGYTRLVDNRFAELSARNQLNELKFTSRDVERVAKYT